MRDVFVKSYDSPIGELLLGGSRNCLYFIYHGDLDSNLTKINKNFNIYKDDNPFFDDVLNQLDAYFNGKLKKFSVKLELIGTEFQKQVWNHLLEIDYGNVKTYKEVAIQIGRPKAVRAVGSALNKNPISIIVPCHRVVGSNGSLTGYAGGLNRKDHLINLERKFSNI